ncbi:hypothetical protein [Pseudorhizobium pelagicum]|uniref:Integrase catalytic domain-containing protein n=1 Tax=Pseudorhizobium pelagicum TaxID=1509405 RepID=A0A922TBY5_9HYPH|nr:hypothetical protein [Pseudorhizobium pelagicum]KEQ08955.1 hypothetical protein GV67_10615 [Pseudorhizobium pelagicum]KEQ09946.1 hypothetical protein GV68_21635 [Pseudorhizobium pelagicum]
MSFMHNKSTFLANGALVPASSFAELDIPPHPLGGGKNQPQRYNFGPGSQFAVFNLDRSKVAYCSVLSRAQYGVGGEKFMVQNTDTNEPIFLSDWQLSILEREYRLVPLNSSAKRATKKVERQPVIRNYLALKPETRKAAIKRWWYARKLVEARQGGEVMLTKKIILEVAERHAREKGDKKPPSYNALRSWLGAYENNPFNRLLALALATSGGNTVRKFDPRLEEIIDECVQWAWELPAGTARDVESQLKLELSKSEHRQLVKDLTLPDETLLVPSFRTIERRFAAPDRYSKDLWRFGPEYARRKHTIYTARALPDHVLGLVEVDYTLGDIVVCDDEFQFLFGRPHVLMFVDKKSGSIPGFAIHFEDESFEAFLHGLRLALYPKDMSRFPGVEWNQYGDFIGLVTDGASFLRGHKIISASEEIGFELVENVPGEPTGKGLVERMLGTLMRQVFHKLPGTTMSNPERRKLFDESKGLGLPLITMRQLEDFITLWIAEYHKTPRRGIGVLPRLKAIPQEVWDAGQAKMPPRDPIDPEIFLALGGYTVEVTIQNDGMTSEHISYISEDLLEISTHPDHRPGKKYKLTIEWGDISNAFVVNPYRPDRVIRLRANGRCLEYARGTTRYQHKKTVEHHNKLTRGKRVTIEDLIVAKRTLSKELAEIYDKKGLQRNAQALLKFRTQVSRKLKRSAIVTATTSAAASVGHIDFAAPLSPKPKRSRSLSNPGNDRDGTPDNLVVMDADGTVTIRDPLEDTVKEHKRRGTPRTEKSGPVRVTAAAAESAETTPVTETTIEDARAARRARLAKNGEAE